MKKYLIYKNLGIANDTIHIYKSIKILSQNIFRKKKLNLRVKYPKINSTLSVNAFVENCSTIYFRWDHI
jgi:hypothetical protein